jgi:hypothetical protein
MIRQDTETHRFRCVNMLQQSNLTLQSQRYYARIEPGSLSDGPGEGGLEVMRTDCGVYSPGDGARLRLCPSTSPISISQIPRRARQPGKGVRERLGLGSLAARCSPGIATVGHDGVEAGV